MSIKTMTQKNLTWINIDKIDEEAIKYLKDNYNFHHLDYEDLISEQQIPKIDTYKDYLFIVFQFPHWRAEDKTVVALEVDVFVGDNFLITVQSNKSKEMKNFFYRCMNNRRIKAGWMNKNSGFLLYRLIEALFENMRPILNTMGAKISEIEKEIYHGEQDTKVIKQLAAYRRNILHFRRLIDPQKYLISNLANAEKPFIDKSLKLYFENIHDNLSSTWSIIETYKDTIDGLHVVVESLINQRTNKVISALTVISVSLLPLTLLSGIYGMNITGLPWAREPMWVWGMYLVLTSIILFIIFWMRKKKLL